MDPVIHWTGSKKWLAPYVQRHLYFPGARIVEPFAGGAAVTFACEPTDAWLNDRCGALINFYANLDDVANAVVDAPTFMPGPTYYELRDEYNQSTNLFTRARLFYVLNCHAFNHLYRENSLGQFNVPYRPNKKTTKIPTLPMRRDWAFTSLDFRDCFATMDSGDFVFADPPYDQTFDYGGFVWKDQVTLAHMLAVHPGPIVATNAATPRVLELYRDLKFVVQVVDSAQQWHHAQGHGGAVAEMVATNFEPPCLFKDSMTR